MHFFKYLLIGLLVGNFSASVLAQSHSAGTPAEVVGVYFTPSTHAVSAPSAIIQTIDASQREVLVQAYGFTHNGIAQALVRAHRRGVAVRVLMDQKSQATNSYVVGVLTEAHVVLRLDGKHAIAHNKVMVIDQSLVITGSLNFTNGAATRNAENTLILRSEALAEQYRQAWQTHWEHSVD